MIIKKTPIKKFSCCIENINPVKQKYDNCNAVFIAVSYAYPNLFVFLILGAIIIFCFTGLVFEIFLLHLCFLIPDKFEITLIMSKNNQLCTIYFHSITSCVLFIFTVS